MPETALLPKVFDRALIARHLARRPPGRDDFVTRLVLADLADRLGTVTRDFEQAIILVARRLGAARSRAQRQRRSFASSAPHRAAAPGVPLVDPEALDLPRRGYDLIVSIFDLDVVDDVPGFLARARAHLRGDGLFLAAAIGGDSLTELREAFLVADAEVSGGVFPRVAPFIPLSEAAGLLQRAGLGAARQRCRNPYGALWLAARADARAEGAGGVEPAGRAAAPAGDVVADPRRLGGL